MHKIPLPYHNDSSRLFPAVAEMPYPVFLDSGLDAEHRGRFDILSAAPSHLLITQAEITQIFNAEGLLLDQDTDGLALLEKWLQQTGFDEEQDADALFNGGAIGFFSYDLGRQLEDLPQEAVDDISLPLMQVGLYPWAILVDHQEQMSTLIYRNSDDHAFFRQLADRLAHSLGSSQKQAPEFRLKAPFSSNTNSREYLNKFSQIIDLINSGDCYQVNLAQRFSAPYEGDTWSAYKRLRQIAPTPFSAYMKSDQGDILSLSPERFLRVSQRRVETRPIKGTRPRSADPLLDQQHREELTNSEKDRAENLMIVDLLRNDLGRTCLPGSIEVDQLFVLESYANVHHLVSSVKGRLGKAIDAVKLLKGCFPGGSITGAPKIRAMEIIESLEPHRRSIYCGSIGYIAYNGNMDTSICIRTLVANQGQLHCWAGGGIVADSEGDKEYQETFDKISNLTRCLEQEFLISEGPN